MSLCVCDLEHVYTLKLNPQWNKPGNRVYVCSHVRVSLCLLVNLPLCVLSFICKSRHGACKVQRAVKVAFFSRSGHSWEVLEFPRLYIKVEVSVDWVIFSSFILHGCKYAVCHVDRVWHTSVSGSFVKKRDHTCLCIYRHGVWVGKKVVGERLKL